MIFLTCGIKNSKSALSSIQDSWWTLKLLLCAGLVVAAFFIPNSFFEYYGWASMVGAVLFILIQLVLLVDFAYNVASCLVNKYEESGQDNRWYYFLLSLTVSVFTAATVLTILMYVFFTGSDCKLNAMYITINLIACAVISALSVFPTIQEHNPRAGLLQSAIVTVFSTYLIWSAFNSYSECKPPFGTETSTTIIGIAITFIAVGYSTISAASSSNFFDLSSSEPLLDNEAGKERSKLHDNDTDTEDEDDRDDEHDKAAYSYTFFHIMFTLGYMYIGMVLTNWATFSNVSADQDVVKVDSGEIAFWLKIASSWATLVLYLWTLLAPMICPDREW